MLMRCRSCTRICVKETGEEELLQAESERDCKGEQEEQTPASAKC
jgi:hypothetical protein